MEGGCGSFCVQAYCKRCEHYSICNLYYRILLSEASLHNNSHPAALLLKIEKRIAEVPVESKELGFTKPGPYIYELFSELNITHETASMLIGIIEEASVLLEESKQLEAKGGICRLETMGEILKLIFREKENSHSNFYRVRGL